MTDAAYTLPRDVFPRGGAAAGMEGIRERIS